MNSPIRQKQDKSVKWTNKAPDGQATEFDIIITKTKPATGWPGQRSMGTSLVGSLALTSGETVWVVSQNVAMPDLSKGGALPFGKFFKGRTWRDLKRGQPLRSLLFQHQADGSRTVFDLGGIYNPSLFKLARLWARDIVKSALRWIGLGANGSS